MPVARCVVVGACNAVSVALAQATRCRGSRRARCAATRGAPAGEPALHRHLAACGFAHRAPWVCRYADAGDLALHKRSHNAGEFGASMVRVGVCCGVCEGRGGRGSARVHLQLVLLCTPWSVT